MQQPGTKYEIGGPGTTGPPAGDGPAFIGFQLCAIKREWKSALKDRPFFSPEIQIRVHDKNMWQYIGAGREALD